MLRGHGGGGGPTSYTTAGFAMDDYPADKMAADRPAARLFPAGIPARAGQHAQGNANRIIVFVHHALFEGDNGVVGDMNFFGTDFRAAFGNVA